MSVPLLLRSVESPALLSFTCSHICKLLYQVTRPYKLCCIVCYYFRDLVRKTRRKKRRRAECTLVCISQLQGKFDAVTIKGKRLTHLDSWVVNIWSYDLGGGSKMNHRQHLETFVREVNIDLWTYFRTSVVNSTTYTRLSVEVDKTWKDHVTTVTIIPIFLLLCIINIPDWMQKARPAATLCIWQSPTVIAVPLEPLHRSKKINFVFKPFLHVGRKTTVYCIPYTVYCIASLAAINNFWNI